MKKCNVRGKFIILIVFVLMLLALNVCIGTVNISVSEVIDVLLKRDAHAIYTDIIMQIRLPRTLASFILGAALALSGYLLQTFFNNPIAGPFILGISSGAKMVVALFMVYALEIGLKMTSITMILAAFAGAMLSILFVLIISRAVDNMGMLIVAGVMIGYICSAVTDFLVTFADDSNIVNLHNWSLGSFSGITWENVYVMAVVVFICFCCVFLMSKSIAAYLLGEAYASNMGVNIRKFRIYLVVLSGILSACVTAFAGPISFVGIAVPHLVKRLFKNTKPIIMIPACSLGGGIFCLFCDLLSRIIFAPTELSVSTITAILGAPVVIYIMVRRKKEV